MGCSGSMNPDVQDSALFADVTGAGVKAAPAGTTSVDTSVAGSAGTPENATGAGLYPPAVLGGVLKKKGWRRKAWEQRYFEFDAASRRLRYYHATGPDASRLKGEGTLSGVEDVPDSSGARQNRFNILLSHHQQRGCKCAVEMAAASPSEKARWIGELRTELEQPMSWFDDDGRRKVAPEYSQSIQIPVLDALVSNSKSSQAAFLLSSKQKKAAAVVSCKK